MIVLWIATGVVVTILVLIALFDKRVVVFKSKNKKSTDKQKPVKVIAKKSRRQESVDSEISFIEKEFKPKNLNPEIKDFLIEIENDTEYGQTSMNEPRLSSSRRRHWEDGKRYPRERKKSIKQQIKDLSPEMKAIVFANVFGKNKNQ